MNIRLTILGVTAVLAVAASAAPKEIQLPPDSVFYKEGTGSALAMSQCLICHSAEYVTTQPPLPRAAWQATVEKMQKVYGAPLNAEQVAPLVDYLVANYGAPEAPSKAGSDAPPQQTGVVK